MEKQLQEHIESLLRLYDEARTTDEQEAELATFFRTTKDVPEEWMGYADLFSVFDTSESLFSEDELDDCLMQPISQQDEKLKTNRVWLYSAIGAVAASVLLLLILDVRGLLQGSPCSIDQTSVPNSSNERARLTKRACPIDQTSVPDSSNDHEDCKKQVEEMVASTEKNEVTSAETEELASVVEPVEDKLLDIEPQPMYDYDPRMEDPFLMAEKHIRDIRSRGERLQQEVALVMNR